MNEQPKPTRKAPRIPAPWEPIKWEEADVGAFQALQRGEADAAQQKRVLDWLLQACGTYDLSYRPNSERDTCFAEGKRHVGLAIVKLVKIYLPSITKQRSEHG